MTRSRRYSGGEVTAGVDVLAVAPHVPAFDRAAGSLRLAQILEILARRYRVEFVGRVDMSDPESRRYINWLQERGIPVHASQEVDVSDRAERVSLCVFFQFFSTAEENWRRVRRRRPDLPAVVDSIDVHVLREIRAARYARRPWLARWRAARTRKRELRVYAQADLILAVTENDRSVILRELPGARVAVIPIIYQDRDAVPTFDERQRNSLLFVGGFVHEPNADAILYFCREVLPLVKQTPPDVTLTIVGDRPPPAVRALAGDGVLVTGWGREIAPYLDSHCAAIAPLRYGAGMKGKVGEALAAGLPIITTSVGAEGMDLEDGKTARIADTRTDLAAVV